MYIQWCVKGIAGRPTKGSRSGLTKKAAFNVVRERRGILSNWWHKVGEISPPQIAAVINEQNLDRHLHDYDNFKADTPFISLAAGSVERDVLLQRNVQYSAKDTALEFATDCWAHPGALFYCWVPVALNPAVEIVSVAEEVRELNVYRRWSPFQLEGEITAKIEVPANQISRVEWWNASHSTTSPEDFFDNPDFVAPTPITNIRELF